VYIYPMEDQGRDERVGETHLVEEDRIRN
jgi:hypothetical protein